MRSLPLKLAPGSDLRNSLEELGRTQGIHGFVLGVVGNLSRAAPQGNESRGAPPRGKWPGWVIK